MGFTELLYVMQTYWPSVRLSQSPRIYGFHFMNWASVVSPPILAAMLVLFNSRFISLLIMERVSGDEKLQNMACND